MAFAVPFFPIFLSILLSLFSPSLCGRGGDGGGGASTAAPGLVQSTCNETTCYDFCVDSLRSDPESRRAADVKALSVIAVRLAISNATSTSAFAAAMADSAPDAPLRAALRSCAAKYANSRQALLWSLEALAADSYDYAFVHVSAAAEYPNVCRVLFRRQSPRQLPYPLEMARREQDLERLCTVALEIISLLG